MRNPVLPGLLAAVLALAGCTSPEQPEATPSPSPLAESAGPRYVLNAQSCAVLEFGRLDRVIAKPLVEEPVAQKWEVPANFLYTGGIQCLRLYGPKEKPTVLVSVGMATYQSPKGALLAHEARLVKHTTKGSLPGVDLMSHAHDDTAGTIYVVDGNLFVEVQVSSYDGGTRPRVSLGVDAPAIEEFTARLIERLRAGRSN